jgi:sugar phosphate isomerase/epimerase
MAISPLPILSISKKPKYKLGYQLYSIRDEMAKDPIHTLQSLKKMGYEDFEAYGFNENKTRFYGFPASDLKKILDDLKLTITSCHYGFSDYFDQTNEKLRWYVDQCITGAKHLNSRYITWPWVDPKNRNIEGFKKLASKLNLIGESVMKAGLGFAYHNHGYEFDDHNGQNGFDIILSETDPSFVKLQMDMYWVMHSSKYTPQELIHANPKRYVMWHIKDMDKVSRDYSELGSGSIDYLKILPFADKSYLDHYYIEQGGNYATNSMQSAADSASYFKKTLQKFL